MCQIGAPDIPILAAFPTMQIKNVRSVPFTGTTSYVIIDTMRGQNGQAVFLKSPHAFQTSWRRVFLSLAMCLSLLLAVSPRLPGQAAKPPESYRLDSTMILTIAPAAATQHLTPIAVALQNELPVVATASPEAPASLPASGGVDPLLMMIFLLLVVGGGLVAAGSVLKRER